MSRIGTVLDGLHQGEQRIARDLERAGRTHPDDPEISYLTRDLANWSHLHVERIAQAAAERDISLQGRPVITAAPVGLLDPDSRLVGADTTPPMHLLADLRHLHREAAVVSVDWELLAQGAQATGDEGLVDLASQCHPETLRQLRWTNTMLKVLSPQALSQ